MTGHRLRFVTLLLLLAAVGCERPVENAREEGYDEGYSDGYDQGLEEGKEEALDCVLNADGFAEDAYYECA